MVAAIFAILAATAAPASQTELSNQAKVENLMVVQLWTDDSDGFLKAWGQATPPNLRTTTTIERNKHITAFVIFAGCKGDAAGKCNLRGSFVFHDPDGQIYGEQHDLTFWDGPAPDGYNLRLSPIGPSMVIEDKEKLGDYSVNITITDRNSGATAVTEEKLTVVEAGAK